MYHLYDCYSVYCTSSIQNIIFELEKKRKKIQKSSKCDWKNVLLVTREWELEFLWNKTSMNTTKIIAIFFFSKNVQNIIEKIC